MFLSRRKSRAKGARVLVAVGIITLLALLQVQPPNTGDQLDPNNVPPPQQLDLQSSNKINASFLNITSSSPGLDLYIHTAFIDDRFDPRVVRILGMERNGSKLGRFICKWDIMNGSGFSHKGEVQAERWWVDTTWPVPCVYYATVFTCVVLPDAHTDRVELVSIGGDHRHVYEVAIEHIHTRDDRHSLAVCVKPMLGHFRITRLLEWFEIQEL